MKPTIGQITYDAFCDGIRRQFDHDETKPTFEHYCQLDTRQIAIWEHVGQTVTGPFRAALCDAITVFREDDKRVNVSEERLETWKSVAAS